ncbi:4Fe-4S binding protein [Methanocaldococcus sp.]
MIVTLLDRCRSLEKCENCPLLGRTSKCKEVCPTEAIFYINNKSFSCLTCGECAKACPNKAIKKNKFGGYYVDRKRCNGCGICKEACPINIIRIVERDGKRFPIGICSMCGMCVEACPFNARISSYELLFKKREGLVERYLKVLESLTKNKIFSIKKVDITKKIRKNIKIDLNKCISCLKCSYLCPRKTIMPRNLDYCTSCNLCGEVCPKNCIENGVVNYDKCVLCLRCVNICPTKALKVEDFKIVKVKEDKKIKPVKYCINCKLCAEVCESGALKVDYERDLLLYSPDLCWKCGKCIDICPNEVRFIEEDRVDGACSLCGVCIDNCPVEAIKIEEFKLEKIEDENCILCGTCYNVCPKEAIIIDRANKSIIFTSDCVLCETCSIHCPRDVIPNTTGFKKVVDRERSFIRTDMDICIKCGLCNKVCPNNCIDYGVIEKEKCEFCGACYNICPTKAIFLHRTWKSIPSSY